MIATIVTLILISLLQAIVYLSLAFRHAYLRQKLLNRTNPDEQAIINKTDLDFWSFLK